MNIIIDGHGEVSAAETFCFTRPQGKECRLYYFTREGIAIKVNQSNNIIEKIIAGDFTSLDSLIARWLPSRIHSETNLMKEHYLYPMGMDWDIDGYFGIHSAPFKIDGVEMVEFAKGNTRYIRISRNEDSSKRVRLSKIIEHYEDGQHNFFWMACNVDE